jgi:hypothetical protein
MRKLASPMAGLACLADRWRAVSNRNSTKIEAIEDKGDKAS